MSSIAELELDGYETPRYVTALLKDLDDEIARLYWNKNQKEWNSPLFNTGTRYKNDTFELKAYDWDAEDNKDAENYYNFKYKDFKIYWYKHVGRGSFVNKQITPEEMIYIYDDCLNSLYRDFKE